MIKKILQFKLKMLVTAVTMFIFTQMIFGCHSVDSSDQSGQFTISGTVSGLNTGNTVTVSDVNKNTLLIFRNGSFVFPYKVSANGSYSIFVSKQPNDEICTVNNGKGTNVTANVSNVLVKCSKDSYTIGGKVSGLLSGQQVTLINNGDINDLIMLKEDGTFVFRTPISYLSSYDVTISKQPSDEICTVNNGKGINVTSKVSNIRVECDQLVAPVEPITGGLTGGFGVKMMINNQGPFLCEIDTGSTNLMVPGDMSLCSSCNADTAIDTSVNKLGQPFTVYYGSGRILHAHTYTTNVSPYLTKVPSTTQNIGLITSVSGNLNSAPILGMAQPVTKMGYDLTTYMQSLVNSGITKDLGFMLVLCPNWQNGSEMVLGNIDLRLKKYIPLVVPLEENEDHYIININGVGIVGKNIIPLDSIKTMVDTGNQRIELPFKAHDLLINMLKNQVQDDGIPDDFWYNLPEDISPSQINKFPTIIIKTSNQSVLSIPPQFYIRELTDGSKKYALMIVGHDQNSAALGLPLLTAYSTYFNRSTQTLEFYDSQILCTNK